MVGDKGVEGRGGDVICVFACVFVDAEMRVRGGGEGEIVFFFPPNSMLCFLFIGITFPSFPFPPFPA